MAFQLFFLPPCRNSNEPNFEITSEMRSQYWPNFFLIYYVIEIALHSNRIFYLIIRKLHFCLDMMVTFLNFCTYQGKIILWRKVALVMEPHVPMRG